MTTSTTGQWVPVCPVSEIVPNAGACVLVDGKQVAVFRLAGDDGEQLFAIDNHDPCSGANVLSRGLVGNLGERLVVASPIYKQHFDLATGACIEDETCSVRVWPLRVVDGQIEIAA